MLQYNWTVCFNQFEKYFVHRGRCSSSRTARGDWLPHEIDEKKNFPHVALDPARELITTGGACELHHLRCTKYFSVNFIALHVVHKDFLLDTRVRNRPRWPNNYWVGPATKIRNGPELAQGLLERVRFHIRLSAKPSIKPGSFQEVGSK